MTAAVIVLAIVLGGGTRQGLWSDAIVQLAGLTLLMVLVFRARRWPRHDGIRFATVIVVLLLAIPLIQLIELPPSLWALLPGRASIALSFEEAAIALPWMPISRITPFSWN